MAAEDVQITCRFLTKLPAAYKVPDTAVVSLACVAAAYYSMALNAFLIATCLSRKRPSYSQHPPYSDG